MNQRHNVKRGEAASFKARRRNLVVVRAGARSLHPSWLTHDGSWEIAVSYYERPNVTEARHRQERWSVLQPGGKWDGLYAFLSVNWEEIRARYDYVWLPDDDLAVAPHEIDRLFAAMRQYSLAVGQPALTQDSYFSHFVCVACPGFRVRYTNFVEVMAPCLQIGILERVLPLLRNTQSGFGLDYVWCRFEQDNRYRAAILDEIQAHHTRPVGRHLRQNMARNGLDPHSEEARTKAEAGLVRRQTPMVYAALGNDGRRIESRVTLAARMAANYFPSACRMREPRQALKDLQRQIRRQLTRRVDLSQLSIGTAQISTSGTPDIAQMVGAI